MKNPFLYLLNMIILAGCGFANQESAGTGDDPELNTFSESVAAPVNPGAEAAEVSYSRESGIKQHEFRDARTGLIVQTTAYPSDWRVISKPIYTTDQKLPTFLIQITGPGGLKNFNTPIKFHVAYSDPQMSQYMLSSPMAKLLRPLPHPKELFAEEVRDRMENSGFHLLGERSFPETDRFLRNKIAAKSKAQTRLITYNTEWADGKGRKALAGISIVSMQQPAISGSMQVWFYSISYTFAEEASFEQTLTEMQQAIRSTIENPQWEQYVAQLARQRQMKNEQRARLAAQQHQNRMNARWAAFNAHQEKMQGIWAAQDANHASFMNRNFGAGSDTGQRQFVNMIHEEETVYNPQTGQNYQVNAGSTEYWMDSEGNYIRNDDLFYTPNGDINLNNREWVRVKRAF